MDIYSDRWTQSVIDVRYPSIVSRKYNDLTVEVLKQALCSTRCVVQFTAPHRGESAVSPLNWQKGLELRYSVKSRNTIETPTLVTGFNVRVFVKQASLWGTALKKWPAA